MEKQENGDLIFRTKKEAFVFLKGNYNEHCNKHIELSTDWFLKEVEKTLIDPDVITVNKDRRREKTYYRVSKQVSHQFIDVTQVPIMEVNPRNHIKTAFRFLGAPWTVINFKVEEIIWKKPDSLIG